MISFQTRNIFINLPITEIVIAIPKFPEVGQKYPIVITKISNFQLISLLLIVLLIEVSLLSSFELHDLSLLGTC